MNARAACLTLWFTAALAALLAAPGREASAGSWSLDRGEYYTVVQASKYTTETLYSTDGDRIEFAQTNWKLQQMAASWRTQLGWRKRLNVLFGFTGLSVAGFDGPPRGVPTNTGLSEIELGLHYRLASGSRALALEALWTGPAGYDRELSTGLGDGRQQLSALLHWGSVLGRRAFAEASGGASYRYLTIASPDSTANLDPRKTSNVYVDLGAEVGFWLGRSTLVGGRYRGRLLASTTGTGGPSNVHAVGPLVLAGDDQLDEALHLVGPMLLFRLDDRIDLLAGSFSTAAGVNTLHFDQVYALAFKQSKLMRNQGLLGSSAK